MNQIIQKLRNLVAKIILIDDYNDGKGHVYPARENQQRAAVHFLWPFSLSILAGHYFGDIGRIMFAAIWLVYVAKKELKESAWQLQKKTVSDVLTKVSGLIGLLV